MENDQNQSSNPIKDNAKLIPEESLLKWMDEESSVTRAVIVQCKLPARKLDFVYGKGATPRSSPQPKEKETDEGTESREELLNELKKRLAKLVGEKNTNLIKAAGSVVVKLTPKQLKKVLEIDGVKEIRINRELGGNPSD